MNLEEYIIEKIKFLENETANQKEEIERQKNSFYRLTCENELYKSILKKLEFDEGYCGFSTQYVSKDKFSEKETEIIRSLICKEEEENGEQKNVQ